MKKDLFRIIDANLNRSREGLRVCEEVVRFVLEDEKLTGEFKRARHRISRSIKKFPGALLEHRDTATDAGKDIATKNGRKNYQDVFSANIQRSKEALRVLEEFSNIFNRSLSKSFGRIRFQVYDLEKKTIARL